jgi:hypothetical protein
MTVATSFDDRLLQGTGWNCSFILLLVANGHQNCIRLPETCRVVIPIKLEFSASVGLIRKESTETVCVSVVFEQTSLLVAQWSTVTDNCSGYIPPISSRIWFCIFLCVKLLRLNNLYTSVYSWILLIYIIQGCTNHGRLVVPATIFFFKLCLIFLCPLYGTYVRFLAPRI